MTRAVLAVQLALLARPVLHDRASLRDDGRPLDLPSQRGDVRWHLDK